MFGWIDTDAEDYPPLVAGQLVAPAFSLVEKIKPQAAERVYTLALNKRLNTTGLDVIGISE